MATTRERLKSLHRDHPDWTGAILARELGVSRERVRQLAEAEGLELPQGAYVPARRKPAPIQPAPVAGGVRVAPLIVAADLIARGFVVFWPLVRTSACDLLTMSADGAVERIAVRTGRQLDDRRGDRRATVVTGEPVTYSPPL